MAQQHRSLSAGHDEPSPSPSPSPPRLTDTPSVSAGQNAIPPAPIRQPSAQPHLEDRPASPRPRNATATGCPLLYTTCWLALFSILGTLSRLGLTALTTYPGAPIGGVIWAQFSGCAVMGFLIEDLCLFSLRPSRHTKDPSPPPAKATLPLYLGLTTGYCGSVTSFSSFLLVAFEVLSNTVPEYARDRGYGAAAALGYAIGTLSLSFSGLQLGAQVAAAGKRFLPSVSVRLARLLDLGAVPAAAAAWGAVIVLGVMVERWRTVVVPCVFAPLGTIVRFWAGRWLNPRVKTFPLGTFTVNMLGTMVLAGLVVGRYRIGSGVGCVLLRGWGDGFCGCLTTVSTFVVEVRGLGLKHAYVYAGTSIIVGFCLMVLVSGSYTWSHDVNTLKC